jgi:hypothetical protein
MVFSVSERHSHDYRPITAQRAGMLNTYLKDVQKKLPTATYGFGGGNAIALLVRIYSEILAKKGNRNAVQEEVWHWLPKDATKMIIEGCYRDSNFVPHIVCMEDDLETLVNEAKESGLELMQRTIDIGLPASRKLEVHTPITPDQVKERSIQGQKAKYKSNSLRLVNASNQSLYWDLFVHHMIDDLGNKVNRKGDNLTKVNGKIISSSEVRVVSNRDQTGVSEQSIAVPYASFQMISYVLDGKRILVANPQYLLRVKANHLRKKPSDTRDPVDIEVLSNMLKSMNIENNLERVRQNGTTGEISAK